MCPDESRLEKYASRRDFARTPEPPVGMRSWRRGPVSFVIQKHAACHLHYDLRLELDGVLKSWVIPKGPSLDPHEKRLALMVEDHPLSYEGFEGAIPEGEYGAGEVIVWDNGVYSPEDEGTLYFQDRAEAQEKARSALDRGHLRLFLWGKKLVGAWDLVKRRGCNNVWVFIKEDDGFADSDLDVLADDRSVLSDQTVEELRTHSRSSEPNRAA